VEAFRYIQTGTHIGKILLKMPDPSAEWHCKAKHIQVDLQNDAVYLLVGGLGGLGRAIATWMWERGARHFIFLSRSAGDSVENQKFLGELQDLGCTASAVAGDVADMSDVQRALSQCAGRHLAGVLQLSMVLRVSACYQDPM
jgi:NAD(P)-dependent dehydrogenase (short-subunit alcohol dehydrogenase family)